ncbi:MAG: MlaD family protein [Bdellovibrionales bacterium]|nr:MlaD family protein [Bdellovibrionales bacterium]
MKPEAKVGLLFLLAFAVTIAFAYSLGALNPFSSRKSLDIAYNFAGGIDIGSPVRVMGIKVGKVTAIEFDPNLKMPDGEEVKLRISVSIDKKAWPTLRTDSRYFINLAGVIGEKFLEITPGSGGAQPLQPNSLVRGEDPPRIDQLISQSYGLAGKIINLIEKNEGSLENIIETVSRLVVNMDKALRQLDKTTKNHEINLMLKNVQDLTGDLAYFSRQMRSPEGQKTISLLNQLLHRLEPLDAKALKKFLQQEGIRAKLF